MPSFKHALCLVGWLLCAGAYAAEPPAAAVKLDIAAQPVGDALNDFARQTGLQVYMDAQEGQGIQVRRLEGTYTPRDALKKLLENTGLDFTYVDAKTVAVRVAGKRKTPAQSSQTYGTADLRVAQSIGPAAGMRSVDSTSVHGEGEDRVGAAATGNSAGIPEILVKGARTSNTDIRRTEDDVQPYVVFGAQDIERSMAPDLGTFLKTRLPMNQARTSPGQDVEGLKGNQSSVDLRGLGADQTLILVNGRRMPGVATNADFDQPDINGIPLAAVERIEILPSTAGGIYGGGATGGVVNIILKRDYNDLELTARYDGAFAGGGAERRVDATAGFTLEGGRTHVMAMASYRDSNPLYVGHRDFTARARALQDRNNHAAFRSATTPIHGYTTNIRSSDGSDLVLKDGMRSLGSPIAYVPVGYAGPGSDNGAAFLGTADRYNLAPADDTLGNDSSLISTPDTVRSLQLSVRREFTSRVELFADATRFDNRAVGMGGANMPSLVNVVLPAGENNPFVQAVRLSVPLVGYDRDLQRMFSRSLSEQLGGGVIARLPREWTVQGEYVWARSEASREYVRSLTNAGGSAALIDGRLDPLSDVNAYPLDFATFYPDEAAARTAAGYPVTRRNATLRVSGPLLRLPGGALRLATLLERREQFTGDRIDTSYPGAGAAPVYRYYREVGAATDSAYAELNAPLVSAANARPGLRGLDVRASYRYDTYTTRAQSVASASVIVPSPEGPFPQVPLQTNKVTGNQYTLGLRYMPAADVTLRLSYGSGILPPSPSQLSEYELPPAFVVSSGLLNGVIDPKRGYLPVDASAAERFSLLGSMLLLPERSASWSGGVIFTPADLPGFRLSVDYTRIEKTDEIGALAYQVLFDLEDRFPGTIVRNALTPAEQDLGYTGGTIREFNIGYVNIAKSLMEAYDIQADYAWETRFGSFAANMIATVQPRLSQRPLPDSEEFNKMGYKDGPLKWRVNTGLSWRRGALELGWSMQYYDAYRIYTSTASALGRANLVLGQGAELIPTQTYHDVYGRYRFGAAPGFAGGLLDNAEVQVSVQNVLDTDPPILASYATYAVPGYATEGDPRLRRYSIAFTRRFGQ